MCSCPEGYYMEMNEDPVVCKKFPETFDRDHLRIDAEYTYNGK